MSQADNAAKEPSMNDILASIRRIIEDNDTVDDNQKTEIEAGDAALKDASADRILHAVKPLETYNNKPVTSLKDAAASIQSNSKIFDAISRSKPEDDKPKLAEQHQASIEPKKQNMPDVFETTKKQDNMISSQVAERVSASFGALTHAIDSNRDSQLNDMTETMLKPMLRDWLDNNLPTIVERLVREEIERLARGEM